MRSWFRPPAGRAKRIAHGATGLLLAAALLVLAAPSGKLGSPVSDPFFGHGAIAAPVLLLAPELWP